MCVESLDMETNYYLQSSHHVTWREECFWLSSFALVCYKPTREICGVGTITAVSRSLQKGEMIIYTRNEKAMMCVQTKIFILSWYLCQTFGGWIQNTEILQLSLRLSGAVQEWIGKAPTLQEKKREKSQKKNGAPGRRSVMTMLLPKSGKNTKCDWKCLTIYWLEINLSIIISILWYHQSPKLHQESPQ